MVGASVGTEKKKKTKREREHSPAAGSPPSGISSLAFATSALCAPAPVSHVCPSPSLSVAASLLPLPVHSRAARRPHRALSLDLHKRKGTCKHTRAACTSDAERRQHSVIAPNSLYVHTLAPHDHYLHQRTARQTPALRPRRCGSNFSVSLLRRRGKLQSPLPHPTIATRCASRIPHTLACDKCHFQHVGSGCASFSVHAHTPGEESGISAAVSAPPPETSPKHSTVSVSIKLFGCTTLRLIPFAPRGVGTTAGEMSTQVPAVIVIL